MKSENHPLESKWHLHEGEVHDWIRRLRVMRIGIREKIQNFVEGPATKSDLAEMRVTVCEYVVEKLKPILTQYWESRILKNSDCDFFFSPGYRPYGGERVPLETPQSHLEGDEALKHPTAQKRPPDELKLGRHSEVADGNTPYFALAAWMDRIYSEEIHQCKIGGFTDWFGKFDKVEIANENGAPLVCLALSLDPKNATQHAENGVARFAIRNCSNPEDLLKCFESQLKMALNSLTINEKGRGETNASSIIPYPPAYVKRNDTWEEVDLSQDLTKLIAQDPLQLTQLEVDELKLAKARFACLFAAIFASPIKIPTALLEDQITKEIETAVASQSNAVFYPYYHVFVTDQDLSIDKKKSTVRADIGSKLGTLNLYTRHPLCDTGLGLIRDTLEAIYDTVRDAEILTAYVRKPYYPDNKFIDHWIMRYVEPWFSVPYKLDVVNSSHPAWHHNGIQNSKQYVREVCSDLLEGFYPPKDTNEKDILPKLFFQTESNKVTPDSQRYFLYCYNILIERVIDHQITWSAPRSKWFPPFMPSFLFFLGLRALVHEAIEGEAAHTFPESIEFGSNHDTSWVEIKLKALNGESLQKRWIEKIDTQIKQNKLPILTGYCGELYRLWKGIIRISDSAKEELDTISLSNLFVKEVNIITICVQSNSAKLTWDNPKVEK